MIATQLIKRLALVTLTPLRFTIETDADMMSHLTVRGSDHRPAVFTRFPTFPGLARLFIQREMLK